MTQEQYSQPAHRPMLVVDIENSSGRPEKIRSVLQRDAFGLLARALAEAGFAEHDYTVDERGDGALVAMPPDCSKARVTDVFMRSLPIWLRRRNELSSAAARLRLRVGMNCGDAVYTAQNSWLGTAVDTLFRLVDAPGTKRALAEVEDASMVLVVSDIWFQDAVRPGLGDTFESDFRPVEVAAHGKRFAAWLAVPGRPEAGPATASGVRNAEPVQLAQTAEAAQSVQAGQPGSATVAEAGSLGELIDTVLIPAAASGKPVEHDAAAARLSLAGEAGDTQDVRRLLRSWARADEPGRRAVAVRALGRRAGRIESAEASSLLTELASDEDPSVAAALADAVRIAAEGCSDRDPSGAWIVGTLAGWTGRPDGRVRRSAGLALIALAADLERVGDPQPGGRSDERMGGRRARDDTGAGEAGSGETAPPWPGLLWFGELSAELGQAVAALWTGALSAPEFARPAKQALDLCARRVEPWPDRREAFVRLVGNIADRDGRTRGPLSVRARRWAEGGAAGARLTGALACRALDP